jgi:hypothetical protein
VHSCQYIGRQHCQAKPEWVRYLELPEVPATTDLLGWWKDYEPEYPKITKMVRQVLGCPISSAGVERLFSKATRVYDKLRKKMGTLTLGDVLMAGNVSY